MVMTWLEMVDQACYSICTLMNDMGVLPIGMMVMVWGKASHYVYEFDIYTVESLGQRLQFISSAKYAPA